MNSKAGNDLSHRLNKYDIYHSFINDIIPFIYYSESHYFMILYNSFHLV